MKLKYLLDTNIISEPLRPAPNRNVLSNFERHKMELTIPSIVWHELLFGCYRLPRSKKRSAIEQYLRIVGELPVLPYDSLAAAWHASERSRLMQLGNAPPFADGQIAAIAATQGLILVTLNIADFGEFQGLATADWQSLE